MNEKDKRAMIYFDETLTNKCDVEFWGRIKNLINNQQKEIEELMKICDSYKSASNHCVEIFSDTINPNYISKDKIRKKLKKLRREENKIYKLDYELEPEKAIDCLLLRIGDLEELLEENK